MQETYGSCDSCLRLLEKYSEEEVPEKQDLTGILHSYQGNCAVQNRRFEGKSRLNSEKIWKIRKKGKLNSEKIWKIWRKSQLNSEKI